MNAPTRVPLRRVRWEARVASSLVELRDTPWLNPVVASSEDRAAVVAVIQAESFRPGIVRDESVVEVRRLGVSTHWSVVCGDGYGAFSLDEDASDLESTHDAEDCGKNSDPWLYDRRMP